MTTKELINQYVTAYADNRWMDASELEALLTEFAEKLKESTSEDLDNAANDWCDKNSQNVYWRILQGPAFVAGAQWQKEQMMKDAIETTIDGKVVKLIVIDE